jgi:hypothetical protein
MGAGASASFTACTIANNTAVGFGAGVYVTDKSTAIFTDCIISNNQANRGGAGISVISGSSLTLNNSNVTDNEAGDATSIVHNLLFRNCSFPHRFPFLSLNWDILGYFG